jgi:hypothetical protein
MRASVGFLQPEIEDWKRRNDVPAVSESNFEGEKGIYKECFDG